MASQYLNRSIQVKSIFVHKEQLPNVFLTQTNKNAPGSEIQLVFNDKVWIPFIWYFGIIWDGRNVSHLEKLAGCCIIEISLMGNGSFSTIIFLWEENGHYPKKPMYDVETPIILVNCFWKDFRISCSTAEPVDRKPQIRFFFFFVSSVKA